MYLLLSKKILLQLAFIVIYSTLLILVFQVFVTWFKGTPWKLSQQGPFFSRCVSRTSRISVMFWGHFTSGLVTGKELMRRVIQITGPPGSSQPSLCPRRLWHIWSLKWILSKFHDIPGGLEHLHLLLPKWFWGFWDRLPENIAEPGKGSCWSFQIKALLPFVTIHTCPKSQPSSTWRLFREVYKSRKLNVTIGWD